MPGPADGSSSHGRISLEDLRRNERWLRRLAWDLTKDADLARDLVQDTFVVALRQPPPPGSQVGAWLAGVLRNLFRMSLRTDTRRERREATTAPREHVPSPEHELDAAWTSRTLLEEVDRLSEPYRTTLLLRYYEGLRASEIADRLGIPAATVRKRNQLGLAELRRRLDRRVGASRDEWLRPVVRTFGLAPGLVGAGPWRRLVRRLGAGRMVAAATTGALGLGLIAIGTGHVKPLRLGGAARGATQATQDRVPSFTTTSPETAMGADVPPATSVSAITDGSDELADTPVAAAKATPPACRSLHELIDAAAPGATVRVPACIFREHVVVMKPITLAADAGAEIRGSDVWTAFDAKAPGLWASALAVPAFVDTTKDCARRAGRCVGPEQVFRDGVLQERVGDGSTPGPGQFALDRQRHVLLAEDPRGHTIEVTVRTSWMSIAAGDVTVRGFRMRHAASHEHTFSVVNPARHVVVRDNVLSHASGPGLTVAGNDHVVEHNEVFETGLDGIRIEPSTGVVVRRNRVHHGGLRLMDRWWWRGGGIVAVLAVDATIEHNEVHETRGAGIYLINNQNVRVQGNVVRDNLGAGVIVQQGERIVVRGNRLWSNGHGARPVEAGVFVVGARDVDVADNALAYHPFGFGVGPLRRRDVPPGFDPCRDTHDVRVHDNLVVASGGSFGSLDGDPREHGTIPACATNRFERNRVFGARLDDPSWGITLAAHERDAALASARLPTR